MLCSRICRHCSANAICQSDHPPGLEYRDLKVPSLSDTTQHCCLSAPVCSLRTVHKLHALRYASPGPVYHSSQIPFSAAKTIQMCTSLLNLKRPLSHKSTHACQGLKSTGGSCLSRSSCGTRLGSIRKRRHERSASTLSPKHEHESVQGGGKGSFV